MHRYLPIGTCAGLLALSLAAFAAMPAQSAPVAGLSAIPGSSAQTASIVDQAGWRRWRWHRNWWWRWRRW